MKLRFFDDRDTQLPEEFLSSQEVQQAAEKGLAVFDEDNIAEIKRLFIRNIN